MFYIQDAYHTLYNSVQKEASDKFKVTFLQKEQNVSVISTDVNGI